MNFYLAQATNDAANTAKEAVDQATQGGEEKKDALTQSQELVESVSGFLMDNAPSIITVVAVIFGALFIASIVGRIIRSSCNKMKIDTTLGRFFAKCARWAILLIAAIFCLGEFGIETSSLAVLLGSAGLAVGLAFQGTLSNLAAGVMLLIFRPFKVEDVVNVGGQTGKVYEIDLFSTIMDTPDNRRIIIPNGQVFGAVIENITFHSTRRVDVGVGVDYTADIDATRAVLEKAAEATEGRLEDPAYQIVLGDLGDSAVTWTVRVWSKTSEYWDVKQAATRSIKQHLDEAGIGIPYPQMDIHVDGSLKKD